MAIGLRSVLGNARIGWTSGWGFGLFTSRRGEEAGIAVAFIISHQLSQGALMFNPFRGSQGKSIHHHAMLTLHTRTECGGSPVCRTKSLVKKAMTVALSAACLCVSSAHGIMSTWTWDGGGTDNLWTTTANWTSISGGSPQTGGNVQFGGNTRLTPNNNINNLQINGITILYGSGAFTLTGNAISIGAGGIANNYYAPQTISMAVTLTANQQFSANPGPLVFSGTIDGPYSLKLSGPSTVTLGAAVGSVTPLTSLTSTGGTTAFSGGTVVTAGGQTYNGSATFTTDTSLTSTGGQAVTFVGSLDGPGALTVNAGSVLLEAPVGATTPLATLTLTGTTAFSGGTVVTAGGQTYNGSATFASDTSLTSTGGNITVQAVNGTGHSLTITASGTTTFNHTVMAVDMLSVSGNVMNVSAIATVIVESANFSAVVNNSGVIVATGCPLTFNGPVVNNGIIEALHCPIIFTSSLVNNGTIITSNCPPIITAIHVTGPDVQISFTTCSNAPYVVDYDTNLVSGTWTALTNVTGTGNNMSVIDPGAAALPQRFYRAGLIVP